MKDSDFEKLLSFKNVGGGLVPANYKADDLMLLSKKGDTVQFIEATQRDIKRHKCYMSLLSFIWGYMPPKFKERVPNKFFYKWLKHLKKQYQTQYSFIDEEKVNDIIDTCLELGLTPEQSSVIASKFGKTDMLEYDSIAFGRMSEKRFKEYVSDQLPFIYENVIGKFFDGEIYNNIIETIEQEYSVFMSRLID